MTGRFWSRARSALKLMREAAITILAALTRIWLIFAILILVWDAGLRLAAQVAPASFWFSFTRLVVLPSGKALIVYRRSRTGDLPISVVTELIGERGLQPCASSGRRIIESDTDFAVVPITRTLPDCNFKTVVDGEYHLHMTASYPAGGAYDKSRSVRSKNAIVVRAGAIVGATPLDDGEDQ